MACRGGAPGRADWDKTHVAALLRARTPRPAAAWSGCHNAHFSSRGEVHSATGGEVWPPAAPRPGAPPRPLSAHFGVSRTLWLFSKYPHPAPGDAPLPPFAASRRSAACRRSMASRLSWEPPQPAFWLSVALWTRGDELPRVSELPGPRQKTHLTSGLNSPAFWSRVSSKTQGSSSLGRDLCEKPETHPCFAKSPAFGRVATTP